MAAIQLLYNGVEGLKKVGTLFTTARYVVMVQQKTINAM